MLRNTLSLKMFHRPAPLTLQPKLRYLSVGSEPMIRRIASVISTCCKCMKTKHGSNYNISSVRIERWRHLFRGIASNTFVWSPLSFCKRRAAITDNNKVKNKNKHNKNNKSDNNRNNHKNKYNNNNNNLVASGCKVDGNPYRVEVVLPATDPTDNDLGEAQLDKFFELKSVKQLSDNHDTWVSIFYLAHWKIQHWQFMICE